MFLTYLLNDKLMLAGEMDDLDEAISVAQHAVDEMPEDHPQFLIGLTTLSHRLRDKFARTGAAHDLERPSLLQVKPWRLCQTIIRIGRNNLGGFRICSRADT